MQYVYNCINPPDLDELEHILDTAEEITREEFVSRVSQDDLKELEENLGYSEEFPMEKDPYVSYWRAWYCGQEILYFRHSCIEYVFKEFEPPVSSTLKQLRQQQVGYRTENFSGSGVRNPAEIIAFEIVELGNTDIIGYVQEHYGLLTDCDPHNLEVMQDNIDQIARTIADYCARKLEADQLEAVWLALYERVRDFYNDGSSDDIEEYHIPHQHIVLADLGPDGALFVLRKDGSRD